MKNTDSLSRIKEQLPFGAISQIAKESGVTYQTVSRVLEGKSNNKKVLKAIADYLRQETKVMQSFNSVANEYLSPVQ